MVGVGGGIAAYKVCELVRRLRESGHEVVVIPTPAALKFVGAATWEALSGNRVRTSVFEDVHSVAHVKVGQQADLVMVAPATANLLAQAAQGTAVDLLTATLLMATAPVVFAPAMHTEMWQHPATVDNVATLRSRGHLVIPPANGRLTGADSGPGRLPEPAALAEIALATLDKPGSHDLKGRHVLISAGGTREPLDPVRYIGNRSSGKQGWALASAAAARGAQVTVVAANVDMPDPAGSNVVRVATAHELANAVQAAADSADAVIMAAAVADFEPRDPSSRKIKKSDGAPPTIALTKTPDVLSSIGTSRARAQQVIVGFAAETVESMDELVTLASDKRERKNADLIVANPVSENQGFELDTNTVVIIDADGVQATVDQASKISVANRVLDSVVDRLKRTSVQ